MKVIIDPERINTVEREFETGKQPLQAILDAFNALNVGMINTLDELSILCNVFRNNPSPEKRIEQIVSDKIEAQLENEKIPMFGGFRMSKRRFAQMVEIPDLQPLIKLLSENHWNATRALELAGLKNNKIVLDKAKHKHLIDGCSFELKTEKARKVFQDVELIEQILERQRDNPTFQFAIKSGEMFNIYGNCLRVNRQIFHRHGFID